MEPRSRGTRSAAQHVDAHGADLGHIVAHDFVAALGHPRHFVSPPLGLEAHAEETQPQFIGDFLDFLQVGADFDAGLVDGFQRGAGKLQLAGRFQGDRGAVAGQRESMSRAITRELADRVLHRFKRERVSFIDALTPRAGTQSR